MATRNFYKLKTITMKKLSTDVIRDILEDINKPTSEEEALGLDKKYNLSKLSILEFSKLYHELDEKINLEISNANEEDLDKHNALYRYSKSEAFKAKYQQSLLMTESSSKVYLYYAENFGKFVKGVAVKVFKEVDVSRSIMPKVGTQGIVSHHTWQYDKRDWKKFYDQYDLIWVKFTLPVIDVDNCIWLEDGDLDDTDFCDNIYKQYGVTGIGIYREKELLVGFKREELLLAV